MKLTLHVGEGHLLLHEQMNAETSEVYLRALVTLAPRSQPRSKRFHQVLDVEVLWIYAAKLSWAKTPLGSLISVHEDTLSLPTQEHLELYLQSKLVAFCPNLTAP